MNPIVARARSCIGARFRPQGRDPALGLDCVGLAAFACNISAPSARYGMRGGDLAMIAAGMAQKGLKKVEQHRAMDGDVLILRTHAQQFHLAILTETGFIHADGRIRRVVEVPGPPPWPVMAVWRA